MNKDRAKITVKFGQADAAQKNNLVKEEAIEVRGPEAVVDKLSPEELITEWQNRNRAKNELAAGYETSTEDDTFGPKYVPQGKQKQHFASKRKLSGKGVSKARVLAISGSVIGAVAVGLILGSIVLNFFKTGGWGGSLGVNHAGQAVKGSGQTTMASTPPQADPKSTASGKGNADPATSNKVSVTLPAASYFVVQGGVFSDPGNAGTITDKIKSHGWPNVFVGEKPQSLLLGIAVNRDNALALAGQYKDFDVFIKELKDDAKTVSIPLKDGEKTSQDEWDSLAQKESEFIKTIGGAIGQGLTAGKLNDDTLGLITTAHRNLLQKGQELINKFPNSYEDEGNRLLNNYTKVVSAMESYQKQPSQGYLWQAEQALLDAYVSKKQLFSSFK